MAFATYADLVTAKDVEELSFINTGNLAVSGGAGGAYFANVGAAFNFQTLSLAAAAGTGTALSTSTTGAWQHRDTYPKTKWIRDINVTEPGAASETIMIVDMLAYWGSCVLTGTPTTLSSVSLPRYADGAGVMGGVVVATTAGGTTETLTLSMTDTDNNTVSQAVGLASAVSQFMREIISGSNSTVNYFLARGKGIKSIDSYTIGGTGVTGTAHFILFKPLVLISAPTAGRAEKQMFSGPFNPVKVLDDACLGAILMPNTTRSNTAKLSIDMTLVSA